MKKSQAELSAVFAGADIAGRKAAFSLADGGGEDYADMRFVLIPDGTSPEAKFSKKHYGAGGAETPHYAASMPVAGYGKGGNDRYAMAFAEVLRSAGIEAKATDWADTDD